MIRVFYKGKRFGDYPNLALYIMMLEQGLSLLSMIISSIEM